MNKFIASLAFIFASSAASADIIKVSFEANITRMFEAECTQLQNNLCRAWDNTNVSESAFFNGKTISDTDTATGYFIYDTDSSFVLSDDGSQAVYLDGLVDFAMTLGQISFPQTLLPKSSGSISVVNDRPISNFLFDSLFASQNFSLEDWFSSINIFLQDSTGQYVNSFDLPTTSQLTDFTSMIFETAFLFRPTGDQLQIRGNVTSLNFQNTTQVNAPSMAIMFGSVILLTMVRNSLLARPS